MVEYANNIRRYVTAAAMDENRRQMKDRYDAYLLEVFFASHHDNFVATSLALYVFTHARSHFRVFPAHFKRVSLQSLIILHMLYSGATRLYLSRRHDRGIRGAEL